MKKLILLLFFFTSTVLAVVANSPMTPVTSSATPNAAAGDNQGRHEQVFNQFKQFHIEGIQSRISIEQSLLGCVQGAQKREELMQCHKTAKTAMESLKQSQKQKFQSFMQTLKQAHPGQVHGQ